MIRPASKDQVAFDAGPHPPVRGSDGKLVEKRKFGADVTKSVARLTPPILWRQRLYVNPASGKLYVAEGDSGVMKSVNQLVEIAPETGAFASWTCRWAPRTSASTRMGSRICGRIRWWPATSPRLRSGQAPDLARDPLGLWRRARQPQLWHGRARGHDHLRVGDSRPSLLQLLAPGGLDVSPTGHLVVTTCNGLGMNDPPKWSVARRISTTRAGPTARRSIRPDAGGAKSRLDKHGQLVYEDAGARNGPHERNRRGPARLSLHDDRVAPAVDGKPFDPGLERDASGHHGQGSGQEGQGAQPSAPAASGSPARGGQAPAATRGGRLHHGWIDGAEWFYGGVGFCTPGAACAGTRGSTWTTSAAPSRRAAVLSVAVLDSAAT